MNKEEAVLTPDRHVIDTASLGVGAEVVLARGIGARGQQKQLKCRILIDRDTLESSHVFQVESGPSIVSIDIYLEEAIAVYNKE